MKQKIILPALAIILLAVFYGPWLLLLFIAIPLGMFVANYMAKRDEAVDTRHAYSILDEVTTLYGEPDEVVVLDATRANELTALILFYDTRGIATRLPSTTSLGWHPRTSPFLTCPTTTASCSAPPCPSVAPYNSAWRVRWASRRRSPRR